LSIFPSAVRIILNIMVKNSRILKVIRLNYPVIYFLNKDIGSVSFAPSYL
jgi:hypothetical protein